MNTQPTTWRCKVCGYLHHASEPPDTCPVCGVPKDDFELFEGSSTPSVVSRWRCEVCGYECEGEEPPDECPVCTATKDCFEAIAEEPSAEPARESQYNVVIIGGSAAGVSAAEAICKRTAFADVTIVSQESEIPYYRIKLTRYIAGEVERAELPLRDAEWYPQKSVELITSVKATRIDRQEQQVQLEDGRSLPYDKLILAMGASPFVPPISGADKTGVFTVRTLADADLLLKSVETGTRCAVIGGGILGLETAGGLARCGADVTVLEGFAWLMPRQLCQLAAERLGAEISKIGINLMPDVRVDEIRGEGSVSGVALGDGQVVPTDIVVIATGIRPNTALAIEAELEVNRGVVVNDLLLTSDPNIYAAGDLVEHRGQLYGLWAPAQYQGGIAGLNAAGGNAEFGGIPKSTTLKVLGVDTYSTGRFTAEEGDHIIAGEVDGKFYHLVFADNVLVGANLVGDTSLSATVSKHVEEQIAVGAILGKRPSLQMMLDYLRSS